MHRRTARESIAGGLSTLAGGGTAAGPFRRAYASFLAAMLVLAGLLAPRAGWAVDASVWTELGRVQTLEARFDQTQTRAVLKQPLQSRGAVRFERPTSALTWQVETPGRSTFSLVGSVARMEYPDLGMNETFDLSQVPDASRLATSLLVWMQADPEAVARDFDTTYGPDTASLRPKDATLKALLSEIRIRFAPGPWRVRTVDLVEPDADLVRIVFHTVRLDGVAVADPTP